LERQHSIESDWVEDEVTKAFEEERKRGQIVLFPVRLDEAVMNTKEAWGQNFARETSAIASTRTALSRFALLRSALLRSALRGLCAPPSQVSSQHASQPAVQPAPPHRART